MENHDYEILLEFLSVTVNHTRDLFEKFRTLPGALEAHGASKKEGYLYLPGKRKDRCLLIAHTDTVWDNSYDRKRFHPSVLFENGVFKSGDPLCGIGADDRAGCAMLWQLRESGHSLLLTDGEEHGRVGAAFLAQNKLLLRELNSHTFMLELDLRGNNGYKTYDLPVTSDFTSYVERETGFFHVPKSAGTDIILLCREICGANLSVGYAAEHSPQEELIYAHWQKNLDLLRAMLRKPLCRYPLVRL